ncbi:hypothetical protein PTSG_04509 [Salpingoeca rosetta]|uniref:Uncharacterized protein n=1 Tax=Salpingoeca rosetta (strain ATCC 50818 / BSB-021) TaxID=946362 RepID=F2U8S4_SALR5|nr:uncharacterized protein PTSG_04509 [Salpingoeca rosetta]EGD72782.1 hypothetical protein PTSG_04509 [Salpingoeca rosetta]|eukprot:XP_004994605.1 hypothetical protein PTSG_04509 [Salpingoeca rosetta]
MQRLNRELSRPRSTPSRQPPSSQQHGDGGGERGRVTEGEHSVGRSRLACPPLKREATQHPLLRSSHRGGAHPPTQSNRARVAAPHGTQSHTGSKASNADKDRARDSVQSFTRSHAQSTAVEARVGRGEVAEESSLRTPHLILWEVINSLIEDVDWDYVALCVVGVLLSVVIVMALNYFGGQYGIPLIEGSVAGFVTQHIPDIIIAVIVAVPSVVLKLYADHQQRMSITNLEFIKSVNFSINWLEFEGRRQFLRFATLNEIRLEELVHENDILVKETLKEAARAEPDQPVLFTVGRGAAAKALKKAAQNVISKQYSEGHVDRAFNKPVESHRLWIAYTFETDHRVPQRKIRVMLASECLLQRIIRDPTPPEFVRPSHAPRWDTLKCIADLYRTNSSALALVTIYRPRT